MDFTKAISYNSLSVNTVARSAGGLPTTGYLVERFQPIPPQIDAYFEKRALTDGMDAGDVYLAGRQFGLIVTAFGSTKGDLWDKAQALLTAFSPTIAYSTDTANRGFLAFDFYQPTATIATWPTSAYPDGIPMRYYLRPMHHPVYLVERDKDGGTASRGFSKRFEVAMQARDPRKYLQAAISAAITTATQTAAYKGDYPTGPIFTWSLSATGSSAFTLVVNSMSNVINLSSLSSGSFTFDYDKKFLYATSSGASKMDLISSFNGFDRISSGSTFKMGNATGISTPLLTYREAFS